MSITEGTQPAVLQWTGAWTTNQTTASFTPESGALLVALVAGDSNANTGVTASVTDSLSGTWTLLKRQNTGTSVLGGLCEVWCRDSPGSALTVSVKNNNELSAGSTGGQLVVRTLIGAKATAQQNGATGAAGPSPGAVQVSVAAGTGNKIYGAALNYDTSTAMSALANTTVISAFSDTTNGDDWEAFKSSGDTAGTATYGYSTSLHGMIAAAEIIAAPSAAAAATVAPAQPGKTWLRRFHHRALLPPPVPQAGIVTASAEVAVVGVAAPFQAGGETDLQLISDAALAVAVVALPPVPAVSALAGVAAVAAVAVQPSVTTSGSASANAGVAAVSVAAVAPSVAESATAGAAVVSAAALAPGALVTVAATVTTVAAVALPPVTAHTGVPGVPAVVSAAPAPVPAVTVTAAAAVIGAVAPGATVNTSGSTNAVAGMAAVAALPMAPSVAVTVTAGVAAVAAVALAAAAGSGKTAAPAAPAAGAVARPPSLAVTVAAGVAAVTALGVNVPPPFTVGTLTASDAPGGVLGTATAPGGSGGVLTASDTRTGGPGG